MIDTQILCNDIDKIRNQSPIIHNITNYVVMNNSANALLAIGASPVMAHAPEEVVEIVDIANALVINIGTLSKSWVDAMIIAGKHARKLSKPIVFDPVGVGASKYRNRIAQQIIDEVSPNIIRANASEVKALSGGSLKSTGVDSSIDSELALDNAQYLSNKYNCVVCISGETDYVINQNDLIKISNGSKLMPKVTGLGCTASALCATFSAVNPSSFIATANAMAVMGIAGEIAAINAKGPGSFQVNFYDAIFNLNAETINKYYKS